MRAGGGDGCVVFDESHKAKNLMSGRQGGKKAGADAAAGGGGGGGDEGGNSWGSKGSSKTAQAVMSLQEQLPKARVVYCSATGASSVRNMAYMERLGLWGAGTEFASFNETLTLPLTLTLTLPLPLPLPLILTLTLTLTRPPQGPRVRLRSGADPRP